MKFNLSEISIKKVNKHLINGDFSAVWLAEEYLKSIKEKNDNLNAYLEVYSDVIEQAKKADEKIKKGQIGVLTGIPIAIKDNILIEGRKASSASKILKDFVAPYDATVIKKLKESGVIFLGRTNMDEFAMGSSTENSAYGPTKNFWDIERVPGGSSGGSAVAVSADMALVSLGSDTGGSIRQPASYCGCVGMKPTYGGVSRYGLMSLASSFDQIGPIAKNISDCKIIFDTIKGKDNLDSTSFYEQKTLENDKRKKIGIPRDFLSMEGIHPDVLKTLQLAEEKFKNLGFEIIDVSLSNISYSLAVYYVIMPAEASSNLARYDGMRYGNKKEGKNLLDDYLESRGQGFGPEVRRRILLGTYVLSSGYYDAYYKKANQARQIIKDDFNKVFEDVGLILMPTTPAPAFKIGEKSKNPLEMYLEDIFTVSANIAGLPAISLPAGFVQTKKSKLPIGVQLIAPHFCEESLFEVGSLFLEE